MDHLDDFSRLVERIYDASLDASLWPEALEQVCAYVDGCAALIFYESINSAAPALFGAWGVDMHYQKLYLEKYAKLNPMFPSTFLFEVGKVYALGDAMAVEEFRATRLYKEWARPQGILDAFRINLEQTTTGSAALMVRRRESDGLFDAEAKARCALIVPHLRRAIAIGKIVEFHKGNETALSETFDGLDAAVLLLAADGRLVHVNEVGRAMLKTADILRAPKERLAAVDAHIDAELQDAIARAARGDAALGAKGLAISLALDEPSAPVAHVLSLASGTRRCMFPAGQAAVAVFVRQADFAAPASSETIAQRYGLTAGEGRVLAAMADDTGVAALADRLGLGQATVKTHLRRIFAKTGAKRQADLVKLLAGRTGSPRP